MEEYLICAGVAVVIVLAATLPVSIIALVMAYRAMRQVRHLAARSGAAPEARPWPAAAPERAAPRPAVPVTAVPGAEMPRAAPVPAAAPARPAEAPPPAAPAPSVAMAAAAAEARLAEARLAARPGGPPRTPQAPPGAPAAGAKPIKWEEVIGLKVLAWAGIIVFLVGAAFFIKYGYDRGWFGKHPWVRVAIPVAIGLALLALGEYFSHKLYRVLARVCTGGGLAAMYWGVFTAWARFKEPLLSEPVAWASMAVITGVAILLAVRYRSLVVAILSLVGGLAAPILIRPERDPGHVLFLYLIALNLGVLALAYFKKWRVLNLLALAGTILNVIVWLYGHYWHGGAAVEKLPMAAAYLTTLWAVYFAVSIVYHLVGRRDPSSLDLPLTLINAVAYFLALYVLLKDQYHHLLGPAAVVLGAAYLVEALIVRRRAPAQFRFVILQTGQALGLLTLAIPIQLSGVFIPMAWAVEACVIYWTGLRLKDWRLRAAGLAVHAASIGALIYYAEAAWNTQGWLVFNSRTATFGAVALAMALSAWLHRRQAQRDPLESGVMATAAGLAHALLMLLVGVEVFRWFEDSAAPLRREPGVYDKLRDLTWARDAILATGLAVYGLAAVGLVAILRRAFHHAPALVAFAAVAVVLVISQDEMPDLKFLAAWNVVGATFAAVAACLGLAAVVSRYAAPEKPDRSVFAFTYELLALGTVLGLYLTEVSRAAEYASEGDAGSWLREASVYSLMAAGFAVMAGLVVLRGLWVRSLAHRIAGLTAMAAAAIFLAVVTLMQHAPEYRTVLWQPRGVAFLLLVAVMAMSIIGLARRLPKASPERMYLAPILAVLVHVVALVCFTLEAEDFWAARARLWFPDQELHAWYARHATLSVGYALYAFALLAAGIRRRSAMLRILALVILGITLAKVGLLDLSRLEEIWRILSLSGLGLLLLAAAFLYYRYRNLIFGSQAGAAGGPAAKKEDSDGAAS
jgi:uncharacterized membrane protein